ncbi:uncharacterized protein [Rutidosis leptorrhynchoides]|uniref:uncharacterized protein n=1 Tax=Rutidosis leptorrhynchoides TaxID=125765 RepID=UPI003A99E241
MSRLDRVLVSSNVLDVFFDLQLATLPKGFLDHLPLFCHTNKVDFGPTPFKCFNSWYGYPDFDPLVRNALIEADTGHLNMYHDRMKLVKLKKKDWVKTKRTLDRERKQVVMTRINEVEVNIENNQATEDERSERINLLQELLNLQKIEDSDVVQKSRVKWDAEDPGFHPSITLNAEDNSALERSVTEDEVRDVVWECGSNKAPGPDGFSFLFIKRYWADLKDNLVSTVVSAFSDCSMPKGVGSAFITLIRKVHNPSGIKDFKPISLIGVVYKIIAKILASRLVKVIDKIISKEQTAFIRGRQILDGPLILNETIDWYKKCKKKLMIMKIDFEKAYDTVSWDFLQYMLRVLRFGDVRRSWIRMCLHSARTSILINGSPTNEFEVRRGLRQGDPLNPFLFLIVMEGLHLCLKDKIESGSIRGATVSNSPIHLSHLLYADDAIFIADWNRESVINFDKSLLYGFGVEDTILEDFANQVGCVKGSLPFTYLGVPMGCNMLRSEFFWGQSNGSNKMHWVRWDQVLNSLDNGGFQIGSLRSFNHALLLKWVWWFVTKSENMWAMVIRAIHGHNGGLDDSSMRGSSTWCNIMRLFAKLKNDGILPDNVLRIKRGDGFLKSKFCRLCLLDSNIDCSIADRVGPEGWKWHWIRDAIGPRNSAHLRNLESELGSTSLSSSEDLLVWDVSDDGHFVAVDLWTRIKSWVDVIWPDIIAWSEWVAWFDSWHVSSSKKCKLYVIVATSLWHICRHRNGIIFASPFMKKACLFDSIRSYAYNCRCMLVGGPSLAAR